MQIFMSQRSGFNRKNLGFFVLSVMRTLQFLFLPIFCLVFACNSSNEDAAKLAPAVKVTVVPFMDDFFTMDTSHIAEGIQQLRKKHPLFSEDYFTYIINSNPSKDTAAIKAFYKAYMPIYKDVKKVNAIKIAAPQIEEAFKRLQYYFPNYKLGKKITLFIGPLESYGNIITKEGIAVGLQLYLGANAPWYFSEQIQTIYPTYISRRFSPEYIAVNSVQNIINDIVPINVASGNVLHHMIEEGKRQYILSKCFSSVPDTVIMGYTAKQLTNLENEESDMWAYFLKQNILFSKDPNEVRAVMQESPYSDFFGEELPGNTGKYIGYKIVTQWMSKKEQKNIGFEALLNTPSAIIFESANYAP